MADIAWIDLVWCIIPVGLTFWIFKRLSSASNEVIYASARMAIQLILMGYALVVIFEQQSKLLTSAILLVMVGIAAHIAIRPIKDQPNCWRHAALAVSISVLVHLLISVVLILKVDNWLVPHVAIPLAGLLIANSMNAIGLSTERYLSELEQGVSIAEAKRKGFSAAMIPQINGLLAVGLVALPGMMTGQILSGVSPLIAVRYQIVIMTMTLGASALGAVIMLYLTERQAHND